MMEEEMGSLKEKVSDFSAAHKVHEERCINDDITTTNKLNAMNERVLEIRQLVGVDALSKGLASFKLINEMRRNAKIEDGFMVPLEEQGDDDNLSKKASKSTGANNNNNNDRIKSPKKGISTASRK